MTKRLIIFLLVLGLFMMFSVADLKAATSQNIWITVSCSGTLSILVVNAETNWFVTSVLFNTVTNRSVATIVSNDGNVTETLNLEVESYGAFGMTGWSNSISTNNALNIYVLQGLFGTNSQPANFIYSQTTGNDDVILEMQQISTLTNFGDTAWSGITGVAVNPNEKRSLWLKLQVPSGGQPLPITPTMRCIISVTAL